MTPSYTREQFAVKVLKGLGAPVTHENVRAMVGWAKAEGGDFNNDSRFNPLNTTQPMPGAGNTGTQGNIKVYKSLDQGVAATVQTLKNGRYKPILAAFSRGDSADAVGRAIGQTPWGTNPAFVQQVISGTKIGGIPTVAPAARPLGHNRIGQGAPAVPGATNTVTTPSTTKQDIDGALLDSLMNRKDGSSLLHALDARLSSGKYDTVTPAKVVTTTTPGRAAVPRAAPSALPDPMPKGAIGSVVFRPGTRSTGGRTMQAPIQNFLKQLAGHTGPSITVGTGTNHNQFVLNTNRESDHWQGNAADLDVGGNAQQSQTASHNGDLIAAHAIQQASGVSFNQALAMAQKGGVWNFNGKHGRVQILWKTMTGGNHYDHVHVGVK